MNSYNNIYKEKKNITLNNSIPNMMKNKIYISILNKIKHKPILLQSIFPFTEERPFIFPYILRKDKYIKKDLKKAFSSLQKNNNISEMNIIIYKFVTYRLLSETKITDYYYFYLNWNTREDWNFQDLNFLFESNKIDGDGYNKKDSLIDYYNEILIGNFYKEDKDKNIHIQKTTIEQYFPKGKKLKKFIEGYFSTKDILFIPYDDNFTYLIKQIFDFLIESKAHITEIIFHKKYYEYNHRKYLNIFINNLKEQHKEILSSFNLVLKLTFDGLAKIYKLYFKKQEKS